MSRKLSYAAIVLPAALLFASGCKSKPSTPEPASQPTAQTAPAPSNTTPSASTNPAGAPAVSPAPSTNAAPGQVQANPQPNAATSAMAPRTSAAPAPPLEIVVPAGTVLHVRLVQALGSKISQDGQRFDATLSSPVTVKGERVIPSGTEAVGTVTEAHAAGRFKGGATLVLQLNSIHLNGKVYPIRTTSFSSESKGKGKRTAEMVGGGTAGGALIGGLAGGGKGALIGGLIGAGAGTAGAATGNRDITLRSETPLTFELASSLKLPPHGSEER